MNIICKGLCRLCLLALLLGSAVSQAGGTGVPGNSSPAPSLSCSASRYPVGSCAAPEIMVSSQAASLHITVPSALAAFIGTRAVSFISGSREESKILL